MTRIRARHALIGGAVIAACLSFKPLRDTILLQNEAGGTIPFLLFFVLSTLPAARVVYLRLRTRAWPASSVPALTWAGLFFAILGESLLDPTITAWLGYDLTPWVHRLEGDSVALLQRDLRGSLLGPLLDVVGSAVYSYGYVIVYAGVLGWSLLRDDLLLARPLLRAFLYVWLVGMPAYVFVPVNEPWYGSDSVQNVLHTTMPPSADNPFLEYNLNNELPSLHSALSVACATVLVRLQRRTTFLTVAFPALTLPFFVVYLGVHWVIDAITGTLLGAGAAWHATRGPDGPGKPEIPPPPSAGPNGGPGHAQP